MEHGHFGRKMPQVLEPVGIGKYLLEKDFFSLEYQRPGWGPGEGGNREWLLGADQASSPNGNFNVEQPGSPGQERKKAFRQPLYLGIKAICLAGTNQEPQLRVQSAKAKYKDRISVELPKKQGDPLRTLRGAWRQGKEEERLGPGPASSMCLTLICS